MFLFEVDASFDSSSRSEAEVDASEERQLPGNSKELNTVWLFSLSKAKFEFDTLEFEASSEGNVFWMLSSEEELLLAADVLLELG